MPRRSFTISPGHGGSPLDQSLSPDRRTGLSRWIEQQLQPAQIAENPLLEERLKPLDSVRMSLPDVIAKYSPDQSTSMMTMVRASAERNRPHAQIQRRSRESAQIEQEERQAQMRARNPQIRDLFDAPQMAQLRSGDSGRSPPPKSLACVPEYRRESQMNRTPRFVPSEHLTGSAALRAIYSNRQLGEVLVNLWSITSISMSAKTSACLRMSVT